MVMAVLSSDRLPEQLPGVCAVQAGRWRNLMLVAVVAPFFTSFILRTIAWRQVLADSGPVTSTLHTLHVLPPGESLTASGTAVVPAPSPLGTPCPR